MIVEPWARESRNESLDGRGRNDCMEEEQWQLTGAIFSRLSFCYAGRHQSVFQGRRRCIFSTFALLSEIHVYISRQHFYLLSKTIFSWLSINLCNKPPIKDRSECPWWSLKASAYTKADLYVTRMSDCNNVSALETHKKTRWYDLIHAVNTAIL